jgi:hypothetical protein
MKLATYLHLVPRLRMVELYLHSPIACLHYIAECSINPFIFMDVIKLEYCKFYGIRRPGFDSWHYQKKKKWWVWNGVHSAS